MLPAALILKVNAPPPWFDDDPTFTVIEVDDGVESTVKDVPPPAGSVERGYGWMDWCISWAHVKINELSAIWIVFEVAVNPCAPVNVRVRTPVFGAYSASLTVRVPPILLVTLFAEAETNRCVFTPTGCAVIWAPFPFPSRSVIDTPIETISLYPDPCVRLPYQVNTVPWPT